MRLHKTLLLSVVMLTTVQVSGQDLFDRFKQEADARYDNFRDECNAKYAKFLAEGWKKFPAQKPIKKPDEHDRLPQQVLDKMKNPEMAAQTISASDSETAGVRFRGAMLKVREFFQNRVVKPMVEMRTTVKEQKTKKEAETVTRTVEPTVAPVVEPKEEQQVVVERTRPHTFTYYGTQMAVNMGDLKQALRLRDLQPQNVSKAWTLCSRKEYTGLIQDCLELREAYHLCDWAYLQMLKTMAETQFGKDTNESTFLMAYIFCQSGYRIRLGQNDGHLLMLYGSEHTVYNQPYFKLGNINLYPIGGSVQNLTSIQACDKAINDSEQPLSLIMNEEPMLTAEESQTRVIESDKYPEVRMEVKVNKNLIGFLNDYPVSGATAQPISRWAMYANTPMADDVKEQVYPGLKKALEGLSEQDQVRRLLSLIQPREMTKPSTSLQYEYDDKVWGHDRAFFAEETLFYPYSDCEDHAILFSRLVRDLVGLKVMLVYYPGHLAAAVQFSQPVTGEYQDRILLSNGDVYHICDPTNYIPEPGVTMEGMDNSLAKVILLD